MTVLILGGGIGGLVAALSCDERQADRSQRKSATALDIRWTKGRITMIPRFMHIVVPVTALLLLGAGHDAAKAQSDQVASGKYLVTIMSCHDCHTPGYFLGKPDMNRFLGGSDVGFKIPPGVFHGPNLTPDKETGLGNWTDKEIITAIRKGTRPDGRELAPVMPYHAFAQLTDADVKAIVAYLRTLPPVKNKVPGPFGPDERPTGFIMTVMPGAGMPKPPEKK